MIYIGNDYVYVLQRGRWILLFIVEVWWFFKGWDGWGVYIFVIYLQSINELLYICWEVEEFECYLNDNMLFYSNFFC